MSSRSTTPIRLLTREFIRAPLSSEIDWQTFRRREAVLVGLYIGLLVVAGLLPHAFGQAANLLPLPVLALFGVRLLEQSAFLAWFLRKNDPPSRSFLAIYPPLSVLIHLAFAAAIVGLSRGADSHVAVLLVLPLVAAAFRLSIVGLGLSYIAAAMLCMVEVYVSYPQPSVVATEEYYHAAVVVVIFAVLAFLVRLLATSLRENEVRLRQSVEELQKAKDLLAAEEALAAVGRLSSAIAHEIRNPVAMISSSAAMARRADTKPATREEVLEIIEKESARLEKLTQDFLNYAKPKAPERKAADISDSVGYVTGLARARAGDKGLSVLSECAAGLSFDVDAHQVHQALLNLVMNAIDATPRGGRVTVGARMGSGGNLVMWVENTGEMIPTGAASSQIFEPFYTTKKGGTGLGLAIARNIARAHGGTLWLASNKPGAVRFDMALPPPGAEKKDKRGAPADR